MRTLTLLLAAVTLACEPMTPANLVEPDAGPVDPDRETMIARAVGAADAARCGVRLDADSTDTHLGAKSAYVIPHGDEVPKLWPGTLMVEESDTIRFRVAPQERSLWADRAESWSKPDWGHNCRRHDWGCTPTYAALNPLFADKWYDLWPEDLWLSFNDGDYSNKTYEYDLTEYLKKVPLEGLKCDAQNRHCVGDETVRQIKLDVEFVGGTSAYGCHVLVNIVRDGAIARGDTVLPANPEFTVYQDPGPTIAIYTTDGEQSEEQRRRLEEGIQWLKNYGIQWETRRHTQAAINFFATGSSDQQVRTPRFFLYDPNRYGGRWDPEPGVNNGGLRWLQTIVYPLGTEMRAARKRLEQVTSLLEGRYYFSHESHLVKLDDSGMKLPPVRHSAYDNWVTMRELVDGFTGIEGTRLPRVFVGNPTASSVGANGGVRWLREQLAGGS